MKPIEHLQKINLKTMEKLKVTTKDQSKNKTDHKYQKMIRRVLDEIFPV